MSYRVIVLLFAGCLVAVAQSRVRVIDSSGSGLSGVTVSSESEYGQSDQNGYFDLGRGAQSIRFSKVGYRPLTRSIADILLSSEVRLTKDAAGMWKPPVCSTNRSGSAISGEHMKFVVPRGLRVRDGGDIDYSANVVCRGRECLQHGWGPLWGSGMPPFPAKYLAGLREMTERDIHNYEIPDSPGFEYRGIRDNGTYMRHVGVFGETISHDRVSKDSAQMFDALIDSFCWIEKKR